jgi:probable rRNA maturation factor
VSGPRNQIDVFLEHPSAGRWAKRVRTQAVGLVRALELRGVALAVTLTSDRRIRALNRRWRQKNHATDVLSFPGGTPPPGWPGPLVLGDVVISLDTARRQAKQQKRSLSSELERYLAHGVLHLLGHDHHRPAPARRMAALEDRLLGGPGMVRAVMRPRAVQRR